MAPIGAVALNKPKRLWFNSGKDSAALPAFPIVFAAATSQGITFEWFIMSDHSPDSKGPLQYSAKQAAPISCAGKHAVYATQTAPYGYCLD